MESVIEALRSANQPVPVPLELPDMDTIIDAEQQLLISLDREFREFLLTVSDVICGTLEPVTVADPNSHTYLPEVAATAWSLGVPRHWIPVCEVTENSGSGYYCANELGEIVLWANGQQIEDEIWEDIWHWAEVVWLESAS